MGMQMPPQGPNMPPMGFQHGMPPNVSNNVYLISLFILISIIIYNIIDRATVYLNSYSVI